MRCRPLQAQRLKFAHSVEDYEYEREMDQKEMEKRMNYQPIVFTNENNDKIVSHLIELPNDYCLLLFSDKMWITFYSVSQTLYL